MSSGKGQYPFCTLPKERIWMDADAAAAVLDAFPISEGHTLIIPKRHIELLFDLPADDLARCSRSTNQSH